MFAPGYYSIIARGVEMTLRCPEQPAFVYTLHFATGLAHGRQAPTQHYTGSSVALTQRLQAHRSGTSGARLMEVVAERGVSWEVAQVIPCESAEAARVLEARLKRHSAARRCPLCLGKPLDGYTLLLQGHWPFHLFTTLPTSRSVSQQNVSQVGKRQPCGLVERPRFVRR